MKEFNIEKEFVKYMQRMELDINVMPLDELTERKRAFIAGVSQLFKFLTYDTYECSDDDSLKAMAHIEDQLSIFWQVQGIASDESL